MRAMRLETLWVTLLLCFRWGQASAPGHVFIGEECFPSCVSPIPECPIGDACGANSNCFMWKRGKLTDLVPNERVEQQLHQLPKPCYTRSYASNDSFFVNDTWTRGSCALTHYSPIESDLLLRGHAIVFYGDSLLRQLFNRFVWHLRSIPNVLEQYYHAHALYVRNNQTDALHIGPDDHMGKFHYSLTAQGSKLVDNPTIQLVFIWEPRLEDPDHIDQQLALARRAFSNLSLVMGMNYWSEGDAYHHELVPPQIKRFQDSARYSNMNLFWYPTTSTKYSKRNAFYGSLVNGSNTWILPSEPMSMNAPYAHNRGDTIHYQCGINLKFPGKVENLDRLNTPETKDCRDMFDYNIMQYILNVIAERRKGLRP